MDQGYDKEYFTKLLDDIQNSAVARGATEPEWYDVWVAVMHTKETRDVLSKRNVNVASLSREADYMAEFFNRGFGVERQSFNREDIDKSAEDLISLIDFLSEHEGSEESLPSYKLVKSLISAEQMHINDRISDGDDTKEQNSKIKQKILRHVMSNLETRLEFLPEDQGKAFAQLLGQLSLLIENEIKKGGLYHSLDSEDLIEGLKGVQTYVGIPPSPVEVVEYVIDNSPSQFTHLLHRNGLRAQSAQMLTDPLEDKLPSDLLQSLSLNALSIARNSNSHQVLDKHFVMALLHDTSVRVHLSKLGIKDLMDFQEKVYEKLFSDELENESKILNTPIVSYGLSVRVEELNDRKLKDNEAVEYLLDIIKDNEEIDQAINKAGLRRRMLQGWRKAYDKDEEQDDKQNKRQKKTGFDISDATLNALIDEYCIDYTELASKKKFDPMIGQESALDKISTKMLKKGKKNPIIIGEAGVGKTKIMEGFASAMLKGDVPEALVGGRLLMLDLAQMDDSPFKGSFESRVLPIIKGISERNALGKGAPIILAIDEFAVAQNAGTHSGDPNGFRGLIKPYLTSGDLMLLAATTEEEYRQQVEKDAAIARRLQPVYVSAPTDEETASILKGLKRKYSSHHKLRIAERLLPSIAELSGRYIHTVNQPDKAIDLLDEACALARKEGAKSLAKEHVLRAVSDKTNIPMSFFANSEDQRYANLDKSLTRRVFGQAAAVDKVSEAMMRAKAGLKDPNTPIANFLFVGPTGVGKTELAKALADRIMGDEQEFLVRFDMSEFQDKSSVNRFIGASAGFVGYEEGGALVKAARSKPFAVYLYDEVEKAHEDVFNSLLAPFSDGVVTDGRGIKGNMRQTVNIMTSNLGAEAVMERGKELGLDPVKDFTAWQEMARPIYESAVKGFFRPEFINRLDGIVYFDALAPNQMQKLVKVEFNKTAKQVRDNYGLDLRISPIFMEAVAEHGYDPVNGARPLKRAWKEMVETPLAKFVLTSGQNKLKKADTLRVSVSKDGEFDQLSEGEILEKLLSELSDIKDVHKELASIKESARKNPCFKLK